LLKKQFNEKKELIATRFSIKLFPFEETEVVRLHTQLSEMTENDTCNFAKTGISSMIPFFDELTIHK